MSSSLSSASAADDNCPEFEFNTHGRQGVGVVQPQSGIDYPLVKPSADVRFLIADLQLQFDDPGQYEGVPFSPPFRVHWLYGVGCTGPDPACLSDSSSNQSLSSSSYDGDVIDANFCPVHAQEITIVDRDGRVVFHSPEAAEFFSRPWGDRLHVYEWQDARLGCCLLAVHTKWPTGQSDLLPRYYPKNFFPLDATLTERAIFQLPKRVRSLTVVLENMAQTAVNFVAGYNMDLTTKAPTDTTNRGLRNVTQVKFNATPGAGLGIFSGCDPEPLVIRRINGVPPTPAGDFYMAATDCYWVRQPTKLVSLNPRLTYPHIALTPGNIPTENLPDPAAGTAKNLPGWPFNDNPIYAHLQIGNDCKPCCDCDDYVEVGRYMNKIRDQYQHTGSVFEDIRYLYHENIARWMEARKCFHRRPLRIFLQAQRCPFLDVVIQFCNQSDECKLEVELTVDFTTKPPGGIGVEVPGYTYIIGAKSKPGRRSNKTERAEMGGAWPRFSAYFDAVNPGQSVHAKFRLAFADCGMAETSASSGASEASLGAGLVPYVVTGVLTGNVAGEPMLVFGNEEGSSESSGMLVEATATDTDTLNCPSTPGAAIGCFECE